MPYLKSEIRDYQLPDFINHLIPIVEVQLATPVANNYGSSALTTGTINPGVIWVGSYFQVGLEAVVPVNAESGHGIGVLGQLHLYLDDIFQIASSVDRCLAAARLLRNSSNFEAPRCAHLLS